MTLSDFKDLADAASGIAAAIGVVVGGFWTYLLFVKNREKYPRASVSHEVTNFILSPGTRVIHVAIKVKNTGKVLLPIRKLECRLLWILPPAGSVVTKLENPLDLIEEGRQKISWPMIDKRVWSYEVSRSELEPGETETFWCDFVADDLVEMVQIYSHLENVSKGVIGWTHSSQLTLSERSDFMHREKPDRDDEWRAPIEPEKEPDKGGPDQQVDPDPESEKLPPQKPKR
jgi:hypothetical protein